MIFDGKINRMHSCFMIISITWYQYLIGHSLMMPSSIYRATTRTAVVATIDVAVLQQTFIQH